MFRKISGGLFVLAALLFLLPWVAVTCAGQELMTVSGVQMVIGYDVATPTFAGAPKVDRVEPEVLAVVALGITVLGIVAYFVRAKTGGITRGILGIAGIAVLIALKLKIDNEALREGQGMLQVRYLPGFWLTMVSLLAASLLSLFGFRSGLNQKGETSGQRRIED